MRLVIIGGHLTPALAVLDKLQEKTRKENISLEVYWIGRKFSYEKEKTISVEYQTIVSRKIDFFNLPSVKLKNLRSLYFWLSLFTLPLSIIRSLYLLIRIRPDIVLSFGGYLSFPVCVASKVLKIKIINHEQSITSGFANRLIGRFADISCLSFSDRNFSSKTKLIRLTGNPVRQSIFANLKPVDLIIPQNRKIIYLTGGNLGSHNLNNFIKDNLNSLLENYFFIHQTGDSQIYKDYEQLIKIRQKLPLSLKNNYYPLKYVKEENIGWVLQQADLVIGRSGINTVCELLLLNKRAILIPLPWSLRDEQRENAKFLANLGLAYIIEEKELSSSLFLKSIKKMLAKKVENNTPELIYYRNLISKAAQNITDQIWKIYVQQNNK